MSRAKGVIVADEMGLGKTVQALAAIHAADAYPVIVVCLASLKLNWQREAERWLPGKRVQVIGSVRPYDVSADVVVVNYDVLHAWVDALANPQALIVDEAHLCKSMQARRTKAVIRLSDRIPAGGMVLALTGTPVLNQASEIMPLLRMCDRLAEFGGPSAFKARYGQGRHLAELNRRLRSSCYVRRRKSKVLLDLPPRRWATLEVEGDPAVMVDYRAAEANIVAYLSERARAVAEESGASTHEARRAAWEQALRASAAEHLVAVTALKRLAARAKMPAARAWMGEFLGEGRKLVVFAWHNEVVNSVLRNEADGCGVTGGQDGQARQDSVDAFQTDEGRKVIACSIRAGGVGITLTAASDVLFLEQGWTPADMDQAVDRCHRIGQRDSVTGWLMVTSGTIDEDIARLIERKRRVVDEATDGVVHGGDESGSVLADLVVRLAEKGMTQGV